VDAWRAGEGAPNLLAPVHLDAAADRWPVEKADAILCINMVHISPWAATEGLMRGAGQLLGKGAPLYLYGAYLREGVETAPSNIAFDQSLRVRNPQWGIRKLEDVAARAGRAAGEVSNAGQQSLGVRRLDAPESRVVAFVELGRSAAPACRCRARRVTLPSPPPASAVRGCRCPRLILWP
jgi:hypothetical protein